MKYGPMKMQIAHIFRQYRKSKQKILNYFNDKAAKWQFFCVEGE